MKLYMGLVWQYEYMAMWLNAFCLLLWIRKLQMKIVVMDGTNTFPTPLT